MNGIQWTPELKEKHKQETQIIIDKLKKSFEIPQRTIIYHYSKTENLKKILTNHMFRATRICDLKDKYEYAHGIELAISLIREETETRRYDRNFVTLLLDEINDYKSYAENIYTVSFSLNGDGKKLWENFSGDEGYNIGLYLPDLNFANSLCRGKVLYYRYEQQRFISNLINEFHNYYIDSKKKNLDLFFLSFVNRWHWDQLVSCFTLFKRPEFDYEEEYRVVYYLPDQQNLIKGIKALDWKLFIEIPIINDINDDRIPFNPECINIGPKNNKDADEIRSLFSMANYFDLNRSQISLK